MTTITIEAAADLLTALEKTAQSQATTVESLIKEVLQQYLSTSAREPVVPADEPKKYSFIGIGRSGKKDISIRAEEILAEEMGRRYPRRSSPE
jgi:hypothetical protein